MEDKLHDLVMKVTDFGLNVNTDKMKSVQMNNKNYSELIISTDDRLLEDVR